MHPLQLVPTRLEGMETNKCYLTPNLFHVPTRLEGMETDFCIQRCAPFLQVPTRLEGMETALLLPDNFEFITSRPDLRGWKLFYHPRFRMFLLLVPTRLEGMETYFGND